MSVIRAQDVIDVLTDWFDLEEDQVIIGPNTRMVVRARHIIMYFLRDAGLSWPEVASKLECDHSTAIYGARRVELQRGKDQQYWDDLIEIENLINERYSQRQKTQFKASSGADTPP
jgi:chromosomal replication initiation ATPase DnaA